MNEAARFILDKRKTTRQDILMNECKWLNVTELTEFHSILQLFKVVRWKIPERLSRTFTIETDGIVISDTPRLQLTALGWKNKTTIHWNNLPGGT